MLVMNGAMRPIPRSVPVPTKDGNHMLLTWPSRSWHDDPRLRLRRGEDCGRRPESPSTRMMRVMSIVAHTTLGEQGPLLAGDGPDLHKEDRVAAWWSSSKRSSGAHLVVDCDGSMACLADLLAEQAYHASGPINRRSIGIESAQGTGKAQWMSQIIAEADLIDELSRQFSLQRVIPDRYRGPLTRLAIGGANFVGVVGHRDCTDDRDRYDPDDMIFAELERRGYRRFNLAKDEDLAFWRRVQRDFKVAETGIPGPETIRAFKAAGFKHGLLPDDYLA